MFLFAFVLGFVFCFIMFSVAYLIIRQLIFSYGKTIVSKTEREINILKDSLVESNIIFPEAIVERFKNEEDLKIDDILL